MVELMIAMSTSVVIAAGMFLVMNTSDVQIRTADLTMSIQDSAREGLYQMAQEIRLSASDQVTFGSGNTSITFSIPDTASPVLADYSVNWAGAHSITYALGGTDNTQIIKTDSTAGTTRVIANDVTSVTFTGDATPPNVVTIAISVQRELANGRNVPSTPILMTAKADLRNA